MYGLANYLRGAAVVILLACCVEMPQAIGQRPTVIVEVDVSKLPPEFDPPGVGVPGRLKQAFESEAAALLDSEFKLLSWNAHSAANVPVAGSPRLLLTLQAKHFVTWKIYFEARCIIPNKTSPQGDFVAVSAELFPGETKLPAPAQIEAVTLDRGRIALLTLMTANKTVWQEKLVRRISLCNDLLLGPGQAQWFVVPLKAAELQAHPNSTFEARILTDHPMVGMMSAFFSMHPGGRVFGTQFNGLLRCDLAQFRFNGQSFANWVPDIPVVVSNRVPQRVEVHAVHYERDYTDLSYSP